MGDAHLLLGRLSEAGMVCPGTGKTEIAGGTRERLEPQI